MSRPRVVGITGHQEIPREIAQQVRDGMVKACAADAPGIVGVTCLAAGADQMFASVVLDLGGTIHVVVPALDYESSFADAASLARYRQLLAHAAEVERQDAYPHPSEEAYWDAGRTVVNRSDFVIAVWDGRPAKGKGGTGDIVQYARTRGKLVVNVWPDGSSRER